MMLGTRAVERVIIPGEEEHCCYDKCEYPRNIIAWRARTTSHEIIANIYVDGKWNRVEHYHPECYTKIGHPYGAPQRKPRKK